MTISGSHPCCIDYAPSLSRFLWPCRDKFHWNAIGMITMLFASAYRSWNGWSLESSKSNWMNQHCRKNMTNTPSRPMKLLWLSKGPPGSFQPPPPRPWQAGHKSQELAVSIPGNVLGNIAETCVLCHVKKSGSMKSSWELFLSAVWSHVNNFCSQELSAIFPGTCSKIPRKGSWELFCMFPGGPIQAGPVDGTCLSKKC